MHNEVITPEHRKAGLALRKLASADASHGRLNTASELLELALLANPFDSELYQQWARIEARRGNAVIAAALRKISECM